MNKIINWMGGWPKDGLVSASEWEERMAEAAERSRKDGFASELREGTLKESLASGLLKVKTGGHPGRLRLSAGADAALTRLTENFFIPGQSVLMQRLTSRSTLQIFRKAGLGVWGVEADEEGMDPLALRSAISKHRPHLVYAAPACSDPEGSVWSRERAAEIADICREAGVTLLRDDRQEMLIYDSEEDVGSRLEPTEEGVLSIGQLPPGLVAGLRFGWLAGLPEELMRWDSAGTRADPEREPNDTSLEGQALSDLMRDQPLEPLIDMLRVQCGERMRRLTGLLRNRRAAGLRWRDPIGGFHLWLALPEGLDGEALLRGAWIKGLMFQPGAPFYAESPERNTLRLTFAYADERQMKVGVSRLFDAMEDFMGRFDIG